MWCGDNYPVEYETDMIDPKTLEPVEMTDLGYGETDGAISINALNVAHRLNALLTIVQQQQEQIDRLKRHDPWDCAPD